MNYIAMYVSVSWMWRRSASIACVLPLLLINTSCADRSVKHEPQVPDTQITSRVPTVLPLDPLTATERQLVERIALSDPQIRAILPAPRPRVIYIEPVSLKPDSRPEISEAEGPLTRHAEALFFDDDAQVGLRVLVDLTQSTVKETASVESSRVPMTGDDLLTAYKIALQDVVVKEALGANITHDLQQRDAQQLIVGAGRERLVVRPLPVHGTEENDPCYKHRCLQLFFRRGDAYLTEPIVIVDLTARKTFVERSRR
jgi:hypothetical protein